MLFSRCRQLCLASILLVHGWGWQGTPASLAAAVNADTESVPAEVGVVDLQFEGPAGPGVVMGEASIEPTGPNGDQFAGLPATNHALHFKRAGAYFRVPDGGVVTSLDFGKDDPITLEAWVQIDRIANDANLYIVGKGRTYEQGVRENQNYAMRLRGVNREARVSFLFTTSQDGIPKYHRWTSTKGFVPDGQWHHVAISYRFGDPASIQSVVDGETSKGAWDMAGATTSAPIPDDDALWIGSSRAGDPGNSLVGAVDGVRIFRKQIDSKVLAARRRVVPKVPNWPETASDDVVTVTLHPGAGSHAAFPLNAKEEFRFTIPMMALHRLPIHYQPGGIRKLWTGPVLMRTFTRTDLPKGEIELLVRSPGLSRLWVNGELVITTPPRKISPDAHQPFIKYQTDMEWLREPRAGDNEARAKVVITEAKAELILESQIGSATTRCETGETLVAYRTGEQMFALVGPGASPVELVDQAFERYRDQLELLMVHRDRQWLIETSAMEDTYWQRRHQWARAYLQTLPAVGLPESSQAGNWSHPIDRLIFANLPPEVREKAEHKRLLRPLDDLALLRRATLDCLGVPPTIDQLKQFQLNRSGEKWNTVIDELLADERWADHWTSYWQDVLAENPNILKPSLNNSGPFRMWIHDALLVNKPIDRFVTELLRMEGDSHAGAAAGFAIASENDVPMAEKAHIVAGAFLGIDMKCARCHDAPYHPWKQRQLFEFGALLGNKVINVPASSSVPKEFFDRKGRQSPIQVTLHPGDKVEPSWPFAQLAPADVGAELSRTIPRATGGTQAESLASIMITMPQNERFTKVIANRVWFKLLGWGFYASTDDWDGQTPRHPELLEYLSRRLVELDYDLKSFVREIMRSEVYRRHAINGVAIEESMATLAPWHRRLTSEQLVDSMHAVSGLDLETEAVTFDPEGSQHLQNFLNLGPARRAWQLTSLSNERDRPSLALPKAAAVCECLEAFGWQASRQAPVAHRETEPNMVQPGVLANGNLTGWVTRMTEESGLTQDALQSQSSQEFIDRMFLRILSRYPSDAERATFLDALEPGFSDRLVGESTSPLGPRKHRGFATWSNHFTLEANALVMDIQREVAAGPTPTNRLRASWRQSAEDAAWALMNAPEFQFVP